MRNLLVRKWWIGCSGFHYKGWKEKFYPKNLPVKKWFEFYCQYFNTVEINASFYRFPRLHDLRSWYSRSPEDFRFTIKAPRLITHYKRFHNAKQQASDFYKTVGEGLQDKLGTVLFHLHPGMAYSEENLSRILDTLDPAFSNVIEFRHASWWREDVYRTLKRENTCFCSISYPDLPEDVVKTSPVMYYRFHGVPRLYLSSYPAQKLSRVAAQISLKRGVEEVFCYFNNDIEVAAVRNARTLQKITAPDRRAGVRRAGPKHGKVSS